MTSNVNSESRRFPAIATAILLACTLAGFNASADEQVPSKTVKFQDLSVDTPAGAQALYVRIHAAANRVCYANGDWLWVYDRACTEKAEAQAIQHLNLPLLTAYYRTRTASHPTVLTANR